MLDHSRNPVDIATHLREELGQGAFSFVGVRVEEARQASDEPGVRMWNDVASELLRLDRLARTGSRNGGASLWELMQRIEYCRHRATQFERKAAAASEPFRDDMLELAVQWRDLALHAGLQARAIGAGAGEEHSASDAEPSEGDGERAAGASG